MPTRWKMPPIVKVYEAMGALGDGRVRIESATRALVTSSEGNKTYEVEVSDGGQKVASNDNASYWQGYLGYPAIAVLIERAAIPRPPADVIDALAGIPWKEINRRFKNDYAKTIAEVDRIAEQSGHDPDAIRVEAEAILEAIRKLGPSQGKRSRPPRE
ncbi:MAG: hypothetical protein ACHQZS_09840 [Candidatus Binatales bacterium]